jgi:hypothetical protein
MRTDTFNSDTGPVNYGTDVCSVLPYELVPQLRNFQDFHASSIILSLVDDIHLEA